MPISRASMASSPEMSTSHMMEKLSMLQQVVDQVSSSDSSSSNSSDSLQDKYHTMMNSGSEEDQVFEDKDDDSFDMSFRQRIQQQRSKQQQQQQEKQQQEKQQPEYKYQLSSEAVETETASASSSDPAPSASSMSSVELIAVERWTVDHGSPPGSHRRRAASLKITAGYQSQSNPSNREKDVVTLAAVPSGSPESSEQPERSDSPSSGIISHYDPIVYSEYNDIATSKPEAIDTLPAKLPWDFDPNNEGIQSGCRLVKDIYEQITLHDAPPINEIPVIQEMEQLTLEELASPKGGASVSSLARTPQHGNKGSSSQRHDAGASFDTEDTASHMSQPRNNNNNMPTDDRHSFFRHLQAQPDSKMGHMALGTLCSWTLETLQAEPLEVSSGNKTAAPSVQSSPRNNTVLQKANALGTLTTKKPEKKWKLKGYFKKKKNKKVSEENSVAGSQAKPEEPHNNKSKSDLTISIPSAGSNEENDEDRMDKSTGLQNETSARHPAATEGSFPMASPRLQMFGSEYARYLSTSILAPKMRSPRMPSTSASSRYGPFSTSRRRGGKGTVSTGIHQIMSASSFGSMLSKNKNTTTSSSWNLEDQDNAILTGPIVDICITNGSDTPPPKGYYRISQTVDGEEFRALRAGGAVSPRKKSSTYINVKKEPNWHRAAQRPCVTALTVIFPDRQEFVPPGFCVVREHCRFPSHHSSPTKGKAGSKTKDNTTKQDRKHDSDTSMKDQPANFNTSSSDGERVFLCFRRSREGNPITGVLPLQPGFSESIPDGYTVLERSPRNFVASLNPKNGSPVFLAYRQRLANLEPLRPLPLLLSVPSSPGEVTTFLCPPSKSKDAKPQLAAYYCTGGTVVESEVGRYHIMDRSTHDLLSPSSVANRLSLIELSRRKTMPQLAGEYDNYPTSNTRSEACETDIEIGYSSQGSQASSERSNANMSFETSNSMAEYPRNTNASFSSQEPNSFDLGTPSFAIQEGADVPGIVLSSFPSSQKQTDGYYQKLYDPELQLNHDALNFIPVVKTATHPSQLEPQRHLRARTAILTPILTACYQRHGGASLKAVEGLTKLLVETDFFADDVDWSSSEATMRLTLLDLAVQVVCDVATGGTQETSFGACVEFVESAMAFSKGHFNTRTVGYVLRFYLFVFYFGASIPSKSAFPNCVLQRVGVTEQDSTVTQILFDPRAGSKSVYLPGGAPQMAALSLKELITLSIARLQRVSLAADLSHLRTNEEGGQMESTHKFMGGVLSSLVDGAVGRVEAANFTQMAIHQIHRSGGSELFWHDMTTSCGVGLFGKDPVLDQEVQNMFVMAFAILANLVKVASGKIRTNLQTFELRPRDVSSKLLSLELLLHFLQQYRDEQQDWIDTNHPKKESLSKYVDAMVFSIRRLVVPCILANTRAGLENAWVFQRMLRIVSLLWRSPLYRDRMKGEIGMLIEHFALRLLQLGPQLQQSRPVHTKPSDLDNLSCPLFRQQLDLVKEIKRWFSADPKAAAELYLNFDTDITSQSAGPMPLLPGTQWKVFQRICAALCNLAEQCGDLIGEQIRLSQSATSSTKTARSNILGFVDNSVEAQSESKESKQAEMKAIREGARLLRKASLDAIVQIIKCLARTAAVATGKDCYALVASWSDPSDPENFQSEDRGEDTESQTRESGAGSVLNFWRNEMASQRKSQPLSHNFENHTSLLSSVTLDTAFEIARKKSIKKAIEYLIACDALTSSPRDIASFLRVNKSKLDQAALGLYLGENGLDGQETEYWNLIRFSYVRAISFDGMKVEEALRHFLTNCGFQLPGEAQKIDRIMSTFAQCYWEDNAGDHKNCPFQDQDTVFLLSFAIIMLNTDLHKSNAPKGSRTSNKSAHKRITKHDFIKNLVGVDGFEEMKRDYLSTIYDSIEVKPIVLVNDEGIGAQNQAGPVESRERKLKSMVCNARSADALLRGLSVHDVKWASMQDFSSSLEYEASDALSDLTQSCISEAWHQFHGVVNTALETAHLDPEGMEPCVELLKYALVVTICLDLPMERAAFLSQLGRFKVFEGARESNQSNHWIPDEAEGRQLLLSGNPAFERIAGPLDDENKYKALIQVNAATQDLRSALNVDIEVKQEMTRVTQHLVDGEFLLNDPSRYFVRMGDLKKKSNKSGRFTGYRFFLFSDALIYAKRVPSSSNATNNVHGNIKDGNFADTISENNEYKIHEELPLHLMKVVDFFPPSSNKDMMQKAFQVHHPCKTFLVFCSSQEERIAWVSDIRKAITCEIQHKVKMEAARMAAAAATHSS